MNHSLIFLFLANRRSSTVAYVSSALVVKVVTCVYVSFLSSGTSQPILLSSDLKHQQSILVHKTASLDISSYSDHSL